MELHQQFILQGLGHCIHTIVEQFKDIKAAVRAIVYYCEVFSTLNGGPCCTLFATIIEKNAVKSYVASGC